MLINPLFFISFVKREQSQIKFKLTCKADSGPVYELRQIKTLQHSLLFCTVSCF